MLINLYTQLLIMSVVAGGLYLLLKLLSAATMKYFKPSWHYYTYIGIYAFLLLPYHKFLSMFQLSFSQKFEKGLTLPVLSFIMELPLSNNNDFVTVVGKTENVSMLNFDFLPYLLVVGTLVFIFVIMIQINKMSRRIFGVCKLSGEAQIQGILSKCKQEMRISKKVLVYTSPYASTPFLYGILKPRIVLPDLKFTTEELQHVLYHELTHWKRHDPWLKVLLLFINALHWFNPLAYLARHDIEHFCELSCDENVVKTMNHEGKSRYCELMLSILWNIKEKSVKFFPTFSNKQNIERRINMILKNHNSWQSIWISVFGVVIALLITSLGTITAYAVSTNSKTFTGEQNYIVSDKTGGLSIIDTIINASQSSEAVNALFGSNNEICTVEEDIIYYSKIYNSFEETKKIGEKSFYMNHDGISGCVSLISTYRIGHTGKFIANYIGDFRK